MTLRKRSTNGFLVVCEMANGYIKIIIFCGCYLSHEIRLDLRNRFAAQVHENMKLMKIFWKTVFHFLILTTVLLILGGLFYR